MSGPLVAVFVLGLSRDGPTSEVVGFVSHVCALQGCARAWNGLFFHEDHGIRVQLLDGATPSEVCWLTPAEAAAVVQLIDSDEGLEWLRGRAVIGIAGRPIPARHRLDGGRP